MDWYVVIKLLNSTVCRSRLRIARPEVTFFEMCSTWAVQSKDSSIIRPNDFVISTLLISYTDSRIGSHLTKPFLGTNYHTFGFTFVQN
jgi:hypothetical protein